MKINLLFAYFVLVTLAGAVTKQELAADNRARIAATDLFRAGNPAAALDHLRSNLNLEAGPDGAVRGLVQNLTEMACTLYNRRELTLARTVLGAAIATAQPILDRKSAVADSRGSELVSALGLLSEHVGHDARQAGNLYDAATALNPGNLVNADRKKAVVDRQKARAGAGGL